MECYHTYDFQAELKQIIAAKCANETLPPGLARAHPAEPHRRTRLRRPDRRSTADRRRAEYASLTMVAANIWFWWIAVILVDRWRADRRRPRRRLPQERHGAEVPEPQAPAVGVMPAGDRLARRPAPALHVPTRRHGRHLRLLRRRRLDGAARPRRRRRAATSRRSTSTTACARPRAPRPTRPRDIAARGRRARSSAGRVDGRSRAATSRRAPAPPGRRPCPPTRSPATPPTTRPRRC